MRQASRLTVVGVMAPFPSPHEMTWHDSDAPEPFTEGHRICVWSAEYVGIAVCSRGMWLDDRAVPRWGLGRPRGAGVWWCHDPVMWMRNE